MDMFAKWYEEAKNDRGVFAQRYVKLYEAKIPTAAQFYADAVAEVAKADRDRQARCVGRWVPWANEFSARNLCDRPKGHGTCMMPADFVKWDPNKREWSWRCAHHCPEKPDA